ncbi:MAG: hypothetical protein GWN58_27800 [Anaerolineae bacterium]|nr:hypothetical protein [Anaerolineae bacterium]
MIDANHLEQKQKAIKFWMRGEHTMHYVHAVCCVCGRWFIGPEHPEAHHGIIPRNRGKTINEWWNLFPTCRYCHTNVLHTKTGTEAVLNKLYLKIVLFVLKDATLPLSAGKDWINEQIDRLISEEKLVTRPKPHV